MVKTGNTVEYQYGDWLKSSGGRPKSPPRCEKTQRTESDDDIVENTRHTLVVKCLTAEEVAIEFPSDKDGDKVVSLGITVDLMLNDNQGIASVSRHVVLHGIILDSQQIGLGNKGVTANVTSGVDTNIVGENNGDTNLTTVGSMDDTGLKANWAPDCNGPSVLKTS